MIDRTIPLIFLLILKDIVSPSIIGPRLKSPGKSQQLDICRRTSGETYVVGDLQRSRLVEELASTEARRDAADALRRLVRFPANGNLGDSNAG